MLLLGIHPVGHDTCAALIEDGRVLCAMEEERLSRIKHDGAFPRRAIAECLRARGIAAADLDAVCVSYDPVKTIEELAIKHTARYWPRSQGMFRRNLDYYRRTMDLESEIRAELDYRGEIYFCQHHVAHMASAYYLAGFSESALYSIDGIGEIACSVIGEANGNTIRVFDEHTIDFPHSIGLLYAAVTDYLGFLHHCDEGKVMGLAPYGDSHVMRPQFERLLRFMPGGRYELDLDYVEYPFDRERWVSDRFLDEFGPPRVFGSHIDKRHMDIAAGLQWLCEEAMLHTARELRRVSPSRNLSLAGGVALNCVANGRLLREGGYDRIYVQPAAYDAGTALGAALHRYYAHNPERPRHAMSSSYFGSAFTDREVETSLGRMGMPFTRSANTAHEIAARLADGDIVGWYNGGSEFGPRALGNRSILTAPFPAAMKDKLNRKVKNRDFFQPFAPMVRLEDLNKYFDGDHESPFMLLTFPVRAEFRDRLPAITHVDGSARVQTVTREQNPAIHALLCEFERITGLGVVLNTSFNVRSQPIVHTPEEAIETALSTEIDWLVLNNAFVLATRALRQVASVAERTAP